MSEKKLNMYLFVSKDFDAQLESYLLADFRWWERAESNMNLGTIYSDGPKVMPFGEHIKRSWLIMKGITAETLKDGEEIVFSLFQSTDGQFLESAISKV